MTFDNIRTSASRSKKKVSKNRLLRAEPLEPRTLLSASNLLQQMLASAPVDSSYSRNSSWGVGAVNNAPTVSVGASSMAVSGKIMQLSVLGADDFGESNLRYTWAATSVPTGANSPTFSVNGTNAAKITRATFSKAGTYTFRAIITDNGNLSATSGVTVTIDQRLASFSITPGTTPVLTGATQQFFATAKDQFGKPMAVQPSFTWSASGGMITAGGLFTAPGTAGIATVSAASGTVKSTINVTIQNRAPTVSATPTAIVSVSGKTVQLSLLGADDAGESALKYTWTATTLPSGAPAPTFGANGTNAAKNVTATLRKAGTYVFTATITDALGASTTTSVTVTVAQTFARVSVTPATASILTGTTQQFTARGLDQFGASMAVQPAFMWTTSAGSISAGGLLTAPGIGGITTVTARSGSIQGTATVTVIGPPTVAQAAAAATSTVLGKTVQLSVLGAYAAGEGNLTYTWAATSVPSGAANPLFSANGTNTAKNTTVTFKKAGVYVLTATIADGNGRSATSNLTVTVSQKLTSFSITPFPAYVLTSATRQFSATALDQFGMALTTQPTCTWSTTAGTITAGGLFTAPGAAGTVAVSAANGTIKSTINVAVQNRAPTVSVVAAAAANPVTSKTTLLSVLGADDAGETGLRYTWAATSMPSGVPAPTFNANGTNAAKNTTVTFRKAGTYVFTVTITDSLNRSTTSSVSVTVVSTFTSISVTPTTASVLTGATQQFTATARDQFGGLLAVQPAFTWSTSAGSITAGGLLTAPAMGTTATVTARSGAIQGAMTVTLIGPPTVAQAAAAATSTVSGRTAQLSVLGAYSAGESNLTYTWAATSIPSGAAAPTFNVNGTNAAKYTAVTFKKAGVYVLTATIADSYGRTTTSSVSVTVAQRFSSIGVTPLTSSVGAGLTQQFIATARDQFGANMTVQPAFTWTTTSGTITAGGLFTAPGGMGAATITATNGTIKGTATVTILDSPPTVATAAAAAANPVSGKTVQLSVLGADNAGESNLRYAWAATTLPSGAAVPTFSVSGTNAAKNTSVTFKKAGVYVLTATIADGGNLTVTSSVTVTVTQTFTSLSVSPAAATMSTGGTQQFMASALDQFGHAMAVQPTITWSVSAGTITAGGLFTAPSSGTSATITATSGSIQATATVSFSTLGLQDAGLSSLTSTLFVDGSISRADMIQILQRAALDGSVSTAEFNDLKTLINSASALNMPNFVKVLAGNIVNGNQANAYYQGQALGNLTAGSPASRLNTLINKWFFGADHPSIDANVSGGVYRSTSGSLFNGNPTHLNERQGMLGDCYFIAAIGVIADKAPAAIQNMFLDNGDGTWTVRFFANGVADYVTVDRMLPTSSSGYLVYANYGAMYNNSANTLWIPLAEKAYAQWNETGKEGRNGTNRYSAIEGGWPDVVFTQVLGHAASWYTLTNQQTLVNAMLSNKAVAICTYSSTTAYGLVGNHAYGVIGYNNSNATFTLYNPWGSNQPTSSLTWAQLQSTCFEFEVADPTGTVPLNSAVGAFASPVMTTLVEIPALEITQVSQIDKTAGEVVFYRAQELSSAMPQKTNARQRLFSSESFGGIELCQDRTAAVTSSWKSLRSKTPQEDRLFALDEFFRTSSYSALI